MRYMTVDIETTGLDWIRDQIHGVGIGYDEEPSEYHPIWKIPESVKRDLRDPSIAKRGHNLHSFDAKFLRRNGLDVQGEFHDTMILANLFDSTLPLGLKYLSDKFIGQESLENKQQLDRYISDQGVKNIAGLCAKDLADPTHPHTEIIAKYCKEDVENTTTLFYFFLKKLHEMDATLKSEKFGFKKSPLDYYYEEAMPLEKVLFEMEYRGVRVNLKVINDIKDAATKRMEELESKLAKVLKNRIPLVEKDIYDKQIKKDTLTDNARAKLVQGQGKLKFAWSNPGHLGSLLYDHCDLPKTSIQKTRKGAYCVDKKALVKLKELHADEPRFVEILNLISEYKLHAKIATTYTGTNKKGIVSKIRYIDGVPRLFPNYRQTTGTGRLACSNPNLQNLKRDSEIKKFFIPDNEDEVFDDADYSQIELRTGAHVSKDSNLVNAYINKEDVHLLTASRLFGRPISKADDVERQAGKRTNFLTIFDGGPHRLQSELKADTGHEFSIDECKEFIRIWFETYPKVRTYLDKELEFFKKHKFCISETGRVRRLPDIMFGAKLQWIINDWGKWVPKYTGPQHKKEELMASIRKKNKTMRITEEMIGWEASKRYKHAIKAGYNQPIQGLAASITKRSMIRLHNEGRIIANQVHDSLAVSRKKNDKLAKQQVIDIMENSYPLCLPVLVDIKTMKSFHSKDISEE